MPAERVAMHQAREIIRLKFSACVPTREIARRLGVAASTVRKTLKRFESAGLSWPLPGEMTDGALETALYANRKSKRGHRRHSELDWPAVHRELKRKHVTLLLSGKNISPKIQAVTAIRSSANSIAFESKLSPTMTFHALLPQLNLDVPFGVAPPHLHDLRDSFAVGTLLRWCRDDDNPTAKLMKLSTFLGHVDPASTAVSLAITADLLEAAARRFGAFVVPLSGGAQ